MAPRSCVTLVRSTISPTPSWAFERRVAFVSVASYTQQAALPLDSRCRAGRPHNVSMSFGRPAQMTRRRLAGRTLPALSPAALVEIEQFAARFRPAASLEALRPPHTGKTPE